MAGCLVITNTDTITTIIPLLSLCVLSTIHNAVFFRIKHNIPYKVLFARLKSKTVKILVLLRNTLLTLYYKILTFNYLEQDVFVKHQCRRNVHFLKIVTLIFDLDLDR